MGKASRNKGSKLERTLETVDAIVLVHPAFDLRDLGAHNKSPESYIEGLRQMNQAARKKEKPVYVIPYSEIHLQNLPPEITESWKLINPTAYHITPNIGLKFISRDLEMGITQLRIALGGIYETGCVAGWGQASFQEYHGRPVRVKYRKQVEEVKSTILLKGLSARVIQSITREKY